LFGIKLKKGQLQRTKTLLPVENYGFLFHIENRNNSIDLILLVSPPFQMDGVLQVMEVWEKPDPSYMNRNAFQ